MIKGYIERFVQTRIDSKTMKVELKLNTGIGNEVNQ
jgi:hypothetical protein